MSDSSSMQPNTFPFKSASTSIPFNQFLTHPTFLLIPAFMPVSGSPSSCVFHSSLWLTFSSRFLLAFFLGFSLSFCSPHWSLSWGTLSVSEPEASPNPRLSGHNWDIIEITRETVSVLSVQTNPDLWQCRAAVAWKVLFSPRLNHAQCEWDFQ